MEKQKELWSVFGLNIVIFYFSVESYRLEGILEEDRFDEEGRIFFSQQEGD